MAGERHRGGYGVSQPGSVTNSLGPIFGPWDPFVSEPRLAVANREALLSQPPSAAPPSFQTSIEIECEQVAVNAYGSAAERWVGLSTWREFSVFVHAIDIRPERIRLRPTQARAPAPA